jgi:monoamine oxidase
MSSFCNFMRKERCMAHGIPRVLPNGERFTRRRFLGLLGAIAGSGAAFHALNSWGLAGTASLTQPPELEGSGEGVHVVVLGGGPAGTTAAYELLNQGYEVTLLEANNRLGGHVWTVKQGSESNELGREPRVCEFDEGQYVEGGAWRIPSIHYATLYYCKEFGIPMETHINYNHNAWVYMEDVDGPITDEKLRVHEIQADMRGYTAEILATAIDEDQLDLEMDQEHRDMLIDYLVSEGMLSSSDLTYGPNNRRGYQEIPGGGDRPGVDSEPIPLEDLLPFAATAWPSSGGFLGSVSSIFQQDTMLQPIGGLSEIFDTGFREALEDVLTLNAPVQEIRQNDDEVRIVYRDPDTGEETELTADYCVCAIPLPILVQMGVDFSSDMQEAINGVPYSTVGKIGLQFGRRFWEEDEHIYGGLTLTNTDLGHVHYPTYGYLEPKGVVQGFYSFGSAATRVSAMDEEDRHEWCLDELSKIHPQARDDYESGFSVFWHLERYFQGGSPSYDARARDLYYDRIMEPDGRVYLAGAHCSYTTGWINGAVESAWIQVEKLHERVQQEQDE